MRWPATTPAIDVARSARRGLHARATRRAVGEAARGPANRPARRVFRRRHRRCCRRRGRRGARRVARARRDDSRYRPSRRAPFGAGLLRHRAGRSLVEPVAFRRRALRPSRRSATTTSPKCTHDARGRVRRGSEAADPRRHVRAVAWLLRRVLPEGAAGAAADRARNSSARTRNATSSRVRRRRRRRSRSARRPTTRSRCT